MKPFQNIGNDKKNNTGVWGIEDIMPSKYRVTVPYAYTPGGTRWGNKVQRDFEYQKIEFKEFAFSDAMDWLVQHMLARRKNGYSDDAINAINKLCQAVQE